MEVAEAGRRLAAAVALACKPDTPLKPRVSCSLCCYCHFFVLSFQADPDSLKTVLDPVEVAEAVSRSLPSAAAVVTTPNQRSTEILTLSSAAATAACLVYATG
jgi:hypothetical protein